METHKVCPACGHTELKPMGGYETQNMHRCDNCGLAFSIRIPINRDLKAHYETYGRDDYQSPITTKRYRELLSRFEPYRKKGSILDVGCGNGFFLLEAQRAGWKSYGIEISENAKEICRSQGIEIIGNTLDHVDSKPEQFDIITAIEVIEHLSDPRLEIQKMKRLLRPGGLLYLTTPNFESLNSRFLKQRWDVLLYPEHLTYFSKKSMDLLLVENSFKRISLRTEGVSPGRLISSLQKKRVDFSSETTTDEKLRRSIEGNAMLQFGKKAINAILNFLSLGENLKALYKYDPKNTD